MPVISFWMPGNYRENRDEILLAVNESRPKEQQFLDISEWERFALRNYLNNFIQTFRQWETNKKYADPRNGRQLDAPFRINSSGIQDNAKPKTDRAFKRALTLGEKQIEWLRKASSFNAQASTLLKLNGEIPFKPVPVGELIQDVLDDAAWRLISQQDLRELDKEEKKVREELKKEERPIEK